MNGMAHVDREADSLPSFAVFVPMADNVTDEVVAVSGFESIPPPGATSRAGCRSPTAASGLPIDLEERRPFFLRVEPHDRLQLAQQKLRLRMTRLCGLSQILCV